MIYFMEVKGLIYSVVNDTLSGDAGVGVYNGGNGSDVYVFRTEQDVVIQDLTRINSLVPGIPDSIELPQAIITDYENGDILGLTNGKTKADLVFEDFNSFEEFGINTNLTLPFLNEEIELSDKVDISVEDLEPNNDGILEGTAIKLSSTNQLLGYVLNTNSAEIAAFPESQFISVDF